MSTKYLITGYAFDGYHGSVIHIVEMAEYLHQCGCKVDVASMWETAELVDLLAARGIRLVNAQFLHLPEYYDVVIAYHWPILPLLVSRGLRYNRLVAGCLSGFAAMETPLPNPDSYSLLHVHSQVLANEISRDFGISKEKIYCQENWLPQNYYSRYKTVLQDNPKRIGIISNHVPDELRKLDRYLKDCSVIYYGRGQSNYQLITPEILEKFDIVVSIGKTVQYALGMGIPVYIYDHFGGNGYVTKDNIEKELANNFSGRPERRRIDVATIAQEIIDGYAKAKKEVSDLRSKVYEKCYLPIRMTTLLEKLESLPPTTEVLLAKDRYLSGYARTVMERLPNYNSAYLVALLDLVKKRQRMCRLLKKIIFWRREYYVTELKRLSALREFLVEEINSPKVPPA